MVLSVNPFPNFIIQQTGYNWRKRALFINILDYWNYEVMNRVVGIPAQKIPSTDNRGLGFSCFNNLYNSIIASIDTRALLYQLRDTVTYI